MYASGFTFIYYYNLRFVSHLQRQLLYVLFEKGTQICRHFEDMCSNEIIVAEYLALPIRSQKQRKIQEKLKKQGIFLHSSQVLRTGTGVLMPQRRSHTRTMKSNFLTCTQCKGMYQKQLFWLHIKKCNANKEKEHEPVSRRVTMKSHFEIDQTTPAVAGKFRNSILYGMLSDTMGEKNITDKMILRMGEQLFDQLPEEHNANYIPQRVRMTGRLLCSLIEKQ